jgi:flavodoxin
MKALVVYDSTYGHTEQIAQAIGEAIGGQVLRVREVNPADLKGFDLLIVGSPTHGGWPTERIHSLLKASLVLEGINVAAFDTRVVSIWHRLLRFGYAAPRIAQGLERNGGKLLVPPEGFVVLDTRGPLKKGELERAAGWAKGIDVVGHSQHRDDQRSRVDHQCQST